MSRRNAGLDLARCTAVTSVVLVHHLILFPAASMALQWGAVFGLDLFFSLSGFLIGGILIRMAMVGITPRRVGGFLYRRWMRTLPAYYVALAIVCWFFSRWLLHPFIMMQNFYPNEPKLLVVSWSLVLEEFFYVLFPFSMLAITQWVGGGTRLVGVVAAGLIVACTAGHVADLEGWVTFDHPTLSENPFIRMDCCAYGVLAACVASTAPRVLDWLRRWYAG